jgi:hypothetical protein
MIVDNNQQRSRDNREAVGGICFEVQLREIFRQLG